MHNWNKKFAFYTVALYRVGNYTDSALVGAILFEKAVYSLLSNKNIDRLYIKNHKGGYKGELQFAIELMCKKYPDFNFDEIDDIRRNVRNNITHEINIHDIDRDKIQPMIQFIWKVFDSQSYKRYQGSIDNIDFLTADYAVVDIREMFNENLQDLLAKHYQFKGFTIEDFQELYKLRAKMISLGSKIKKEILKIEYKNELYIDIISKIDTTSAYVWMSMNLYDKDRNRVDSASASILGTPLDLRIYFDIGGGGYEVRQDYYKFLKSDYFANFRDNKDLKDIEIFDNDWYCFIIERKFLSDVTADELEDKIKKSEEKLEGYNKDTKISWNRMLCGYIIDRGKIDFREIEKKLRIIIKLYYCFEYFRQRELKRAKIPFKYNIDFDCNKRYEPKIFHMNDINLKR